jgi:N-acetylglucosamine-6-sulfatase
MPIVRARRWMPPLVAAGWIGCGGGSPGVPSSATPAAQAPPARRPNIVFVLADDLDFRTTAMMPRLPALIGQRGRTFDRAYVTQSLCAPSRASILTGQFPHNHRVLDNTGPDGGFGAFRRGQEPSTIATWLRAAGYRTALIGKYMNGYPTAARPDYIPPGWDEWDAQLSDLTADRYVNYFLNENGTVNPYGVADADYETDVLTQRALTFMDRSIQDKKPFFLYLAPDAPHLPAIPAPRHATLFFGTEAPRVPSFNEPDVSDKPAFVQNASPMTPAEIRKLDRTETARLRTMLSVEDMLADVLTLLAANQILDETYVFFMSDNGLMLGEHRLVTTKDVNYEEAIRVPLIVMGPGIAAASRDDEHFLLNVDIAPTLAELAGAAVPDSVDGRSMVRLLRGESVADWRRDADSESISYTGGLSAVLRTPEYAYTEIESNERELYDMRSDPYQLASLHRRADPALLTTLSARLAQITGCRRASCRN